MKKRLLLFLLLISFSIKAQIEGNKTFKQFEVYLKKAKEAESNRNAVKASEYYAKAIEFCRKSDSLKTKLPILLFSYGSMLSYSGEYTKAIASLNEIIALNKTSKKPDKLLEARVFIQLGVINFFQKNWDESLYYYKKAEKGALELGSKQGLSIAKNNIANIYQKKKAYPKAIGGYKESLVLQKELKDTATICNTYFNIGTCYEELKQPTKASLYFNKSYEFANAINDVEILTLSLIHQGSIATEQKQYEQAEFLLDLAENKIKLHGYRQVLSELYNSKTNLYERQGNYQKALATYKKNSSLLDSIANSDLRMRTKELEVKLKTEEKEQKIILQKEKIKNRNILLWLLSGFSLLGFGLTFTIYLLWKSRKRKNKKLIKLNNTKDRLFSIISHDLKSPAIAQKMAIESLKPQIEELENENVKSYCKILYENTKSQVTIIENLMNWAMVQTEKIKYTPQAVDIVTVIRKEMALYEVALKNKGICLKNLLPKQCVVYVDKHMISIVVRNLINNAVKFTPTNGCITISCKCEENNALISIRDEGIGMSSEQISALYTTKQKVETRLGTKGEKGTGLGLILCKDLLKRNNSNLHINSILEKGTVMSFSLKKAMI